MARSPDVRELVTGAARALRIDGDDPALAPDGRQLADGRPQQRQALVEVTGVSGSQRQRARSQNDRDPFAE